MGNCLLCLLNSAIPDLEYLTIFGKIDYLHASNEIHFLPVQERYIHALSRNTNCLTIDGQVCFYRRLFTDAVKPRGCISRSWGALIGLHGGTKLLLTAVLASLVDCISSCHLPKAQHCSLSPNWCFTSPSAPHPPPPPIPTPSHHPPPPTTHPLPPPTPYKLNP